MKARSSELERLATEAKAKQEAEALSLLSSGRPSAQLWREFSSIVERITTVSAAMQGSVQGTFR